MMKVENCEKLVYVRPKGRNVNGNYAYDFYFSTTPDLVYGPEWDDNSPASAIEDLSPEPSTCSSVHNVSTQMPLQTIEENSCFSMDYAINGIIALAWINIEGMDTYPEYGRMVFHFGDSVEKVENLLKLYDYHLDS